MPDNVGFLMWIVAGVIVVVIVALAVGAIVVRRRARRACRQVAGTDTLQRIAPARPCARRRARSVESLTDATGSSLLDQVDRDGRKIRDRLASGEAHLDALRQPDDTGPLLRRVLDQVERRGSAGETPDAARTAPPSA